MNPLPAIEATNAVPGPLATLQAMLSLLAAPPEPPVQPDAAAAPAETAATPDDVQALAQAQQGRSTLGQLAGEPAAVRAAPAAAPADTPRPALLPEPAPGGPAAARPGDAVAVPVLVTALHSPAAAPPREARAPRRRDAVPAEDAPGPETQASAVESESVDSEAGDWQLRLRQAGQAAALADLARGRRVLLVLPEGALALLLCTQRLQRFRARWCAGTAADWPCWRVFRDGDPLLTRGLRSRSGGACRVLLGGPAALPNAASGSTLEITDRIRFTQALGGQWSLLLLVAPPGWPP